MNILVADDDITTVQDIVKRIEDMQGFNGRVIGADSGEDALRVMGYFTPDLLIADVSVKVTNGQPLLYIVQENNICCDYIILTAHNSFENARQAVRCHAFDYLLKPIDWSILENSINSLSSEVDVRKTINSILSEYSGHFKGVCKSDMPSSFKNILKYINTKYTSDISLTQLSIHSGMGEHSICNLFRKEMGTTFLEYLYQLRLKKAMEILLIEQKKPIKEVSSLVGYNSERQFFRVFKNKIGLTPQQFRKKNLYEHNL